MELIKKRIFTKLAVSVIILALSTWGCSTENFGFRNIVEKYNRAVIEFYRTGSSDDLKLLTTDTEQQKVSQILANMQAENKSLEAELDSINFIETVRSSKYMATVKTIEKWSYRIFNPNEEPNGKFNKVTYDVTYNLTNKNGKYSDKKSDNWLVDTVTITAEKKN